MDSKPVNDWDKDWERKVCVKLEYGENKARLIEMGLSRNLKTKSYRKWGVYINKKRCTPKGEEVKDGRGAIGITPDNPKLLRDIAEFFLKQADKWEKKGGEFGDW